MRLVNNLDFAGLEARNMRLQNLAVAPANPVPGQAYYDTALGKPRVWDGDSWENMGGTEGAVTNVSGTAPIVSTGGQTPQISITPATNAAAGSMSAADKGKLDGIEAGATGDQTKADIDALGINASTVGGQSPANLRDRTTHTGEQPIATVTGLQGALDSKINASARGAANGVASLDGAGKIPNTQLPPLAMTDVNVVASIAARDALVVDEGDVAIVTANSTTYIYDGAAWQAMQTPIDGVTAVTGGTGITSTGGNTPAISITAGGVGTTQLADSGVTAAKIAAAVAGNGLTGGAGAALAVGAGTGITVTADAVGITPGVVARKYAVSVGTGALTAIVVNHNLNTRDVQVSVYSNAAPFDEVLVDVEMTDVNNVTLRFAAAPALNAYRCVVLG